MTRSKAPSDPDSYEAVHYRVRRDRGRADAHECVVEACDRPATEWAWDHTGPSREGIGYRGNPITWGLDIATYQPMCTPHHRQIDRGGTLTHCPRGHDRSVGTNTNRQCRACAREDAKTWRENRGR